MKKIIALLMSCLCILPVTHVYGMKQAAYEDYSNIQTAIALGLMDSMAAQRANEAISRGEFVYGMMQLFANPAPSVSAPFTDLPEREDYRRAISSAYEMGLLSGYGDGTVRSTEPISRMHAAQLLAKCVGFADLIKLGKSAASACAEADICSYSEASDTSDCTVENAAALLLKAGNAKMVVTSSIGTQAVDYEFGSETLLSTYLDIYHAEGVISANEYTYLHTTGHIAEDRVQIGSDTLQTESDEIKNLLGFNVEAYYKQKKGSNLREIICCFPKENRIITIDADDVIGYSNGKIEYYDEDNDIESKSFHLSAVEVVYNNRLLTKASAEDFAITSGSITLIDNNDDGSFEVVSVMSYRNAVVDTVDRLKEDVYFKYGEKPLSLSNNDGLSFVSTDGSPAYAIELAEWDVLSIAESKDGEVIRAVYIPESADGLIESIETNANECIVTMDGKVYTLTEACRKNQIKELAVGKYVILYPDIDGKIAAVNTAANSGERYAYFMAAKSETGLSRSLKIKYLDCNGTIKVSDLADRVKLDGTIYQTEKNANVFLSLKPQLIRYCINEAGAVSNIDTAYTTNDSGNSVNLGENESESSLCKYYDGYTGDNPPVESETLVYKRDNMILGGKIALTGATYIFCVPTDPQAAADSDYRVLNTSNYMSNDTKYALRAYKTIPDSLSAEAIVTYVDNVGSGVPYDTAVTVVESVSRALNAEGDPCYILNCYTGSTKYRYQTRQDSVFDDITLDGASYLPSGGDILKLTVGPGDSVTACELVYSYKQDKMNGSNPNDSLYATYRVEAAYAYQTDKTGCMTTTTPLEIGKTYLTEELSNLEMHNLSRFKILLYDSKEEKVSVANASSVIGFVNTGGYSASRVFIYTRNGNSQTFVIYQ